MIPALVALWSCARLPDVDTDASAAGIAAIDASALPAGVSACRDPVLVDVLDVADGDTITVVDENAVEFDIRFIGADAPEIDHGSEPAECWGPEAAAYTTAALLGQTVWMTFNQACVDLYGRSLAYVHQGLEAADFFNAQMLRDGQSTVLPIPPNNTFADAFLEAQVEARSAGRGMWGACL